ncbi:hypothetical protein [Alistipes shahii]
MKMSNLGNMKYCKETTQTHPIYIAHPNCRCAIHKIIIDEGGCDKVKVFGDEPVINIDAVERCLAMREKREQRPTMDIAFGVSEDRRNRGIVLIDFKYRHKSFKRISKNDLMDKVQGAIDILGNTPCIMPPYLFVVQPNLLNEARNHLSRRLFNNSPKLDTMYQVIDNKRLSLFWIS